jgi:hypothetical protein
MNRRFVPLLGLAAGLGLPVQGQRDPYRVLRDADAIGAGRL